MELKMRFTIILLAMFPMLLIFITYLFYNWQFVLLNPPFTYFAHPPSPFPLATTSSPSEPSEGANAAYTLILDF